MIIKAMLAGLVLSSLSADTLSLETLNRLEGEAQLLRAQHEVNKAYGATVYVCPVSDHGIGLTLKVSGTTLKAYTNTGKMGLHSYLKRDEMGLKTYALIENTSYRITVNPNSGYVKYETPAGKLPSIIKCEIRK